MWIFVTRQPGTGVEYGVGVWQTFVGSELWSVIEGAVWSVVPAVTGSVVLMKCFGRTV